MFEKMYTFSIICIFFTNYACINAQFTFNESIPDFNLTDLSANFTPPNLPLPSQLNISIRLPIKELYDNSSLLPLSSSSSSSPPQTPPSSTPPSDSSLSTTIASVILSTLSSQQQPEQTVTPTVKLREEVIAKNGSLIQLARILPKCHMKRLDDCLMPLMYFTHRPNTTGITPTAKEFAMQCKAVIKILQCVDQYMKECSTLLFRELYSMVKKSMLDSMSRICSNTPMRANYIKHSGCIHAKVKLNPVYKATCVNDLQAALEYMMEFEEVEEWMNTFCCGYNRWEDCITGMTMENCKKGKGTERAMRDLIRSGTGDFMYSICPRDRFNPESLFCEKSLPAKGSKAKGKHSNSAASKYFTLFCPNTGF